MPKEYMSQIETPTDSHVYKYLPAVQTAIQQMDIFWSAEELGVEEDELDFRTKLNKGEQYAVQYMQSKLTKYETFIGGENLWGNKIPTMFPRPEIARACSVIAMVENHSHAPFYMLADKVMNNATDEFYSQWRSDSIISQHVAYLDKMTQSPCPLEVTASLCLLEGVSLFSVLGFFKSFNSNGFNMIPHFTSGIDGSAKDENFHSMFSAYLFNQCRTERTEKGNHDFQEAHNLKVSIGYMADTVYAHEEAIIDHIFDYSDSLQKVNQIRVATREDLKHFVRDRINTVIAEYLGYSPVYPQPKGLISENFYKNLSTFKYSDFFATTQLQYTRNYSRAKLTFNKDALNV